VVVSFTPRPRYLQENSSGYPLDRRLSGSQSRSGRDVEKVIKYQKLKICDYILVRCNDSFPGFCTDFSETPYTSNRSRDSSVGIALGYELDDWCSRVRFPAGAGNFSLHHRVQNGSGVHPASYPMGSGGLSLGVKLLGHEADHSSPSSAEVKMRGAIPPLPNTPSRRGAYVLQGHDIAMNNTA
jgi:hypothetical protein